MTDASGPLTDQFDAVHELFAQEFARGRAPGLVYAVVRDGEILHTASFGTTVLGEERPPSVDNVLRIASMTKSFTAAAVLLLRDRGELALDLPASTYVPELAGRRFAAEPEPTVRHLLTMSGGLLTDDPWGDRNEAMTHDELGAFLAGGFTLAAPPGAVFEYSNLGYAVLGRIVDNLTGGPGGYREFVLRELVGPLGMAATTYDGSAVGPALAVGHHRPDLPGGLEAEWRVEPPVAPGAFSSMGGLHSSVRDLATWIGGFTSAFRDTGLDHPLAAASRREMQQLQRFAGVAGALTVPAAVGCAALTAAATGYGCGLFVDHHSDHGHVVQHSGGYPGYGSHMRWHPETGVGVIALANGTYAAPVPPATQALRLLVRAVRRPTGPAVAATLPAIRAVGERLASVGTDGSARFAEPDLFTANVEQDVPDDERRAQLARADDLVGRPQPGAEHAVLARGLGTAAWSVPAERGRLDLELTLSPEPAPRVQWLTVTPVPHAPEWLVALAREIVAAAPELPAGVPLADDVDTETLCRALAVIVALSPEPPRVVAEPLGGDGERSVELAVVGGGTWWKLALTAAEDGDGLAAVSLLPLATTEAALLSRLRDSRA
ncbi:MAG TPA: serine hydrolase domain-containing protein [Nocardioides sp.]|uniref:serine hydrolase domain-containing protein n=1 Tax=Nocardioides sp. TaxID=35761 RepID=UPI002EDA04E3